MPAPSPKPHPAPPAPRPHALGPRSASSRCVVCPRQCPATVWPTPSPRPHTHCPHLWGGGPRRQARASVRTVLLGGGSNSPRPQAHKPLARRPGPLGFVILPLPLNPLVLHPQPITPLSLQRFTLAHLHTRTHPGCAPPGVGSRPPPPPARSGVLRRRSPLCPWPAAGGGRRRRRCRT